MRHEETTVVALSGTRSIKKWEGESKVMTPFIGAFIKRKFVGTRLEKRLITTGLGLALENGEKKFMGFESPLEPIRTWRAMKILEHVDRTNRETLHGCLVVAQYGMEKSERIFLEKLAQQGNGYDWLRKIRSEVISAIPPYEDLDRMLLELRRHEVPVDVKELRELPKPTYVMLRVITEVDGADYRMESLSAFLKDLGLRNGACGDGRIEMYGESPEDLVVKYLGEPVVFHAADGNRYSFLSAKYANGQFYLKTRIVRKDGKDVEAFYSLRQLRQMLMRTGKSKVSKPSDKPSAKSSAKILQFVR